MAVYVLTSCRINHNISKIHTLCVNHLPGLNDDNIFLNGLEVHAKSINYYYYYFIIIIIIIIATKFVSTDAQDSCTHV